MTVVITGSAQRLARMVTVLTAGERLAARICAKQAGLAAAHGPLARAINAQARQERQHAVIAGSLSLYAGEDWRGAGAALLELNVLDRRISCDLDAGRLADSLYGMQGVLDQLGTALITRLAASPHPVARCFAPVARRVLAQEQGHVTLGEKWFLTLGAKPSPALDAYRVIGAKLAQRVSELHSDCADSGNTSWAAISLRLEGWGA